MLLFKNISIIVSGLSTHLRSCIKKENKVHILSELVQINIQNNLKKKKKNGNACVNYDAFIKLKTFDRLIVLRIITIEKKVRKLQKCKHWETKCT